MFLLWDSESHFDKLEINSKLNEKRKMKVFDWGFENFEKDTLFFC